MLCFYALCIVESPSKGPLSSPLLAATLPVKLLTRVEWLKLLTKAKKDGMLSIVEKFGFFLSSIEKLDPNCKN